MQHQRSQKAIFTDATPDFRPSPMNVVQRWFHAFRLQQSNERERKAMARLKPHLQKDVGYSPIATGLGANAHSFNMQLLRLP